MVICPFILVQGIHIYPQGLPLFHLCLILDLKAKFSKNMSCKNMMSFIIRHFDRDPEFHQREKQRKLNHTDLQDEFHVYLNLMFHIRIN